MNEQSLRTKVLEVSGSGRSEVVPSDGVPGSFPLLAAFLSVLVL